MPRHKHWPRQCAMILRINVPLEKLVLNGLWPQASGSSIVITYWACFLTPAPWYFLSLKASSYFVWEMQDWILSILFYWNRVLGILGQPSIPLCTQGERNLECLIFLPPSPRYWDYRCMPLHLAYAGLDAEPRAMCMLGKNSAPEAHPASLTCLFMNIKTDRTHFFTHTIP